VTSATPFPLSQLTTLRVGGLARDLRRASTVAEIEAALAALPDRDPDSLLVLGGGSNVIISDDGFAGTVLLLEGGTIDASRSDADHVEWVVGAGVSWDDLVAAAVVANCGGIEMMSGIPGRVGAAPLQNIGAYGQQVCDVIESVGVIERESLQRCDVAAGDCQFGFRTSRFKHEWRDRFVVTNLRLRLPKVTARRPTASNYVDVERHFHRTGLSPTDLGARRQAVLDIRGAKSMLVDPADRFARSVGSFFVNPEVPGETARALMPRFAAFGLRVEHLERQLAAGSNAPLRIPAAHLLRLSGFNPGDRWSRSGPEGQPQYPVGLSERHVLAVVTSDGATALDVWQLGHFLRQRVAEVTGVRLDFEPFFIGPFPEFVMDDFLDQFHYLPAPAKEPDWLANSR
jgi:UDP-N-acetylmuramate dehydrogenase